MVSEFKDLLGQNAKASVVARLHPGTDFQKSSVEVDSTIRQTLNGT